MSEFKELGASGKRFDYFFAKDTEYTTSSQVIEVDTTKEICGRYSEFIMSTNPTAPRMSLPPIPGKDAATFVYADPNRFIGSYDTAHEMLFDNAGKGYEEIEKLADADPVVQAKLLHLLLTGQDVPQEMQKTSKNHEFER